MASYRVTWGSDQETAGTGTVPEGPSDPAMPTRVMPVLDPALLDPAQPQPHPQAPGYLSQDAQVPSQARRWAARPRPAAVIGLAAMAAVGAGGATASSAYAAESQAAGGGRAGVSAEDTASNPVAQRHDPGLALAARLSGHAEAANRGAQEARLRAAEAAKTRAASAAGSSESGSSAAGSSESGSSVGALVAPLRESERRSVPVRAGYWSHLNSGRDFAAKPGTVVRAIGDGAITSAAWAGSHGYRVVQTLRDGTQIWYCHLAVVAGQGEVSAGQPVGRVGATGGLDASRLHLEVRTGGGEPQDADAWLARHGLTI
jgi:murein DD-endopeptidase MepM/ murein hydrolase activator NlpD